MHLSVLKDLELKRECFQRVEIIEITYVYYQEDPGFLYIIYVLVKLWLNKMTSLKLQVRMYN